jgi:predicted transcriptional regulator
MLLRNALGETLRDARNRQNRTLRDVSTAANVSLGYLSEVERGRKEASSELLASICDALDLELSDLLDSVSRTMRTDVVPADKSTADKSSVITNSVKAGMGSSNRPRPGSMGSTSIDPTLRIVVPYGSTRPGAPVG